MTPWTTVALILSLVGAVLLWWFPRPTPELDDSFGIALEDGTTLQSGRTAGEERARVAGRIKRNYWLSGIGFALSLLGILLQAFADR